MKSPVTIVGGVVATLAIVAGLILGLNNSTGQGFDQDTKYLIVASIITLAGVSIPGLLALYKAEGAQQVSKEIQHDLHNGVVTQHVKTAIHEMAQDENDPVVIVPEHLLNTIEKSESDG